MRRLFTILPIALLCAALAAPSLDARGRNNGGRNNTPGKPTTSHTIKQSNKPNGHNVAQFPGGPGGNPNNPSGPSGPGNGPNRPGNSGLGPGNNPGNSGFGPGNNPGNPGGGSPSNPGFGFGPTPGPNPPGNGFVNVPWGAPSRPILPAPRPFSPPTPPAAFRPIPTLRLSTILGVALGTALNLTLNSLINNGVTVTGYTNNAVYVSNVPQLNMIWPTGTLYYNSAGALYGSEFVYSTAYYNMDRYNLAYNSLYNLYGAPISQRSLAGGGIATTWWGNNGQYVSLTFQAQNAMNGNLRYYTTLSFGD